MINNEFKLKKERSLGEIISDSFGFVRTYFTETKEVFKKFILPTLVVLLLSSIFLEYSRQQFMQGVFDENNFELLTGGITSAIALVLNVLFQIGFYIVSYISILAFMKQKADKATFSLEAINDTIRKDFLRVFGLVFVGVIIVVIGFFFLLIPGIYLLVPISLLAPIAVIGGKDFSASFTEAFRLIKENWWITFATILIFSLILSFASVIFQVPLIIYYVVKMIAGGGIEDPETMFGNDTDWVLILLTIIGQLGGFIFNLITVVMTGLIYYNLNEYHNNSGTIEDIESIGN
jgi:hypothetical protein